jgi:pimeloyl-ACP methyl ester carboxylesterase
MPELDSPKAPVLILLHGATLNGRMWDPVRRLLDPRWRVLTPDLPGHGARQTDRYTLCAAADTVADVARQAGSAPLVVAGDSLGGYSAMAAAAGLPREQLKGLILGGCSLNYTGGPLRALRWRGRLGAWFARLYGEQRFIRGSLSKQLKRMGHTPADVEALIRAGIHLGAFAQAVDALAEVDFRPRLAAIEQPILFVNGIRDRPAMTHEAEFLAASREATARHFDCEHGASLWRAREFAAMTDEFVARVCRVPAR